MSKMTIWKGLLKDTVEGLKSQGWYESGGSDVFRLLHDKEDNCVKIFLNDYQNPSHIVVRFSSHQRLEEIEYKEIQEKTKVCTKCNDLMLKADSLCNRCGEFNS